MNSQEAELPDMLAEQARSLLESVFLERNPGYRGMMPSVAVETAIAAMLAAVPDSCE